MDILNVNKEILIDNDYASLWYYPDTKIIHHKFKKFIYGDQLKKYLKPVLNILRKNAVKNGCRMTETTPL
ncbi:MAG TPA: hypothetical protein PK604_08135 [Acetivibrio clariflavus]|nr:hypothetical protein [Acetivibrio clariflavus]